MKKLVRQYYTLSCMFSVGGMSVINAIYVTFLLNSGLNFFEVNLVNACYFLTLFICEIPTGAFADIFGRKKSFIIACALMCMSMFMYGSSHTFLMFVLAEILAAVGSTFRSGAFQAWFVDSMKHIGYEGEFTKIFARENLYKQIGGAFGAVGGAYLATINPQLTWYIGGTFMAITTIIAYVIMKEEYFKKTKISWKQGFVSMKNTAVISIHYGMNHKPVRFILIITAIQIFAVQALNMYWQPFFGNLHVKTSNFGYIYVGVNISIALGALIISRLQIVGKEKSMILWTQIWVGACALVAATVGGLPIAIVFYLLHEVGRGTWQPLIDGYLQKRIPSDERATITSFCATAPHIGGAIGLLVSGGIAQMFGINVAWIVSGATLILGSLLVARTGYNNKSNDGSDLKSG